MKKVLSIIFILISFKLTGQELKRVIVKYPKSKNVMELYYVLKSNKTIRNGDYFSFYEEQHTIKRLKKKENLQKNQLRGLKVRGQYKNNLKEGFWTYFQESKDDNNSVSYNSKLEEGEYKNDRKIGIWQTYLEDGKVIKKYDYDANKELDPTVPFRFRYPPEAQKNKIEGIVMVKVVYKNCEPISYTLIKDIGYGCGDEIIRALNEKNYLEKKYGVKGNCDQVEDRLSFRFKLN